MRTILGLCPLSLVCSPGIFSQAVSGFGAVTGTVRDFYGDGLPDTTVVVSNSTFGILRTMTTTDDGAFSASDLPPGSGYTMKVSCTGYSAWGSKDVRISLGESANFKIVLPVLAPDARAQAAATADITGGVKFELSTPVAPEQIESLPVNDRRVDSLVPHTVRKAYPFAVQVTRQWLSGNGCQ